MCVTLILYQESLSDARSTKYKKKNGVEVCILTYILPKERKTWEGTESDERLGLKLETNPTHLLYLVFVPEGDVGKRT